MKALYLASVMSLACASSARMKSSLATRASFDLGCTVRETEIVEVESGFYGVTARAMSRIPRWTSGETCNARPPMTTRDVVQLERVIR